jgi:putative protease
VTSRGSRPEILAPAGDLDCLRAAIENGADAVYFGLQDGFNARARATNFELATLPATMAELHRRGVKGYVAFNTLVFESELAAAEEKLRRIAEAGADALIVQDLGVARLARESAPGLPLHASTQMTISTAEGCEFARRLGVSRAILARELSIAEIAAIHERTELELECFVHGALCVSWSGQCLTSEIWGGRSANRGECAQACRMPYDLVVDGERRELGAVRYLLSPKDLAAFDLLPRLVDAGVVSFKIEGRLKTPEYVANVTASYRRALDQALSRGKVELDPRAARDLEQSFSRGLAHGFLDGVDHQTLVEGRSPKKRGVFLGWVAATDARARTATIALQAPLRAGDGVVFEGPDPEAGEEGGTILAALVAGRAVEREVVPPVKQSAAPFLVELRFGAGGPDLARVETGTRLFKTRDPELERRLRATFTGEPRRKVALALRVSGRIGAPLVASARDDAGREVAAQSSTPLARAEKRALTADVLEEQLGRLGGTIYRLQERGGAAPAIEVDLPEPAFLPLSELSHLRRELVAALDRARTQRPSPTNAAACVAEPALPRLRAAPTSCAPSTRGAGELSVLCRDDAQVEAALDQGVERIYLDYLDRVGLGNAVARVRSAGARAFPATTRIAKPGEEGLLAQLLEMGGAGLLARHLGALEEVAARRARGDRAALALELVGDSSLNATNGITAALLLDRGLARLTPSHDLDAAQLVALVGQVAAERVEVVLRHHLPLFHMEHCVFAHLLSNGKDFRDCGRPCESHAIGLQDEHGNVHPVLADVGCRNTFFHHRPQTLFERVAALRDAGVSRYRIELLREGRPEAREAIERGRAELRGAAAAAQRR